MSNSADAQNFDIDSLAFTAQFSNDSKKLTLLRKRLLKNMHDFDPNYIIENMPGYIYWKNKESKYMGCNQNLATISGLKDRHEIVGKTDYDFGWGDKEKAEQFIKDDQEVMRTGKKLVTEYQLPIKRKDGNYLFIRTEKMPFYNSQAEVIGILAIAVDITDQKLLEKSIIAEKEQVEKLSLAKTEFMRNMEHDMRTPFSGIYSLAGELYRMEKDEEKKQYLAAMIHSSKELLDLCTSIIDFSKMENGAAPPVISKKFNLRDLINHIVLMEEAPAISKKLELIVDYPPDVPTMLLGDDYRLERILINLMGNAIKFTKQGYVKISVKKIRQLDDKNIILRILVEDTGIGIPQDKLNIIFEKFTRVSPSYMGHYKGTGLGLPIVKQLIEALQGEIALVSEIDKGTTFSCDIPFRLPLVDD